MQLLHHCGREVDELAAIFTPALIVTDSLAKREKVCGREGERERGGVGDDSTTLVLSSPGLSTTVDCPPVLHASL